MNNITSVISQYADDTSILLDDTKRSLENCLNILNVYAKASGLYIDIEKTKVVWIGSEKGSNRRLKTCEEHNFSWESNEFTVLDITFPKHLVDIIEVNYRKKIDEMKKQTIFMLVKAYFNTCWENNHY